MECTVLIRLSGMLLVLLGCLLAGRELSDVLKQRKIFLKDSLGLVRYLEKEMLQRKAGMTEAFLEASNVFGEPWRLILKELSELSVNYTGSTFDELWDSVMRKYIRKSFLREEEWGILLHMSTLFSGADIVVQKTLMKGCMERIEELEKKASEDYEIKSKLYQRLSVFAAAFLILVLV